MPAPNISFRRERSFKKKPTRTIQELKDRREAMIADYLNPGVCLSMSEIARKYGVTRQNVSSMLRRWNVPVQDVKERASRIDAPIEIPTPEEIERVKRYLSLQRSKSKKNYKRIAGGFVMNPVAAKIASDKAAETRRKMRQDNIKLLLARKAFKDKIAEREEARRFTEEEIVAAIAKLKDSDGTNGKETEEEKRAREFFSRPRKESVE